MSNINPNNINVAYPAAGQDNDSQGFRDNFNSIKNNLQFAKTEIEGLRTDVTAAQTQITSTTSTVKLGSVGSTATITYPAALTTMTTTVPLALSFAATWPLVDVYGKVRVRINVAHVIDLITFPPQVTVGLSKLGSVAGQVLTPLVGTYLLEFSTSDAGATVMVVPLITP